MLYGIVILKKLVVVFKGKYILFRDLGGLVFDIFKGNEYRFIKFSNSVVLVVLFIIVNIGLICVSVIG